MRLSEHLQQVLLDLGDVALLLDGEGGDGAHAAGGDQLGGVHGRSMFLLLLGVGWQEDSRLRRGKRRGGRKKGVKNCLATIRAVKKEEEEACCMETTLRGGGNEGRNHHN